MPFNVLSKQVLVFSQAQLVPTRAGLDQRRLRHGTMLLCKSNYSSMCNIL